MKLTTEQFDAIPDGKIFAQGILPNSPEGLFMTQSGGELLWIAKKGYGFDWTIYCHWSHNSIEWIELHGDKVTSKDHILKCVPCEKDVFNLYRF